MSVYWAQLVGNNSGGVGLLNAYMSWAVTKDIYLSGVGAPFGMKTMTPWMGRQESVSFEIKTMNINPSIAWRATDWVSSVWF